MSFRHMIISFKMMDRLIEYWNSNKIEWHVDRGLKLNSDGNMPPQGSDPRHAINSGHLLQMNRYQRQMFESEARQSLFCVSCFKPGSLTVSTLIIDRDVPFSDQKFFLL